MTVYYVSDMNGDTSKLWTIEELAAQVALVLAPGEIGTSDGRIREVPDTRTIRYYTTLGLLDRPVQMRGRTALYGRKHLLQLVAIKRLQAQGKTLVEIQQQLLGKSESELEAIALWSPRSPEPVPRLFWKNPAALPSQPAAAPPADELRLLNLMSLEQEEQAFRHPSHKRAKTPATVPLQGIPLREGVTLLVAAQRPLTPEDIQMLEAAAEPLLKCLEKRRLIDPLS